MKQNTQTTNTDSKEVLHTQGEQLQWTRFSPQDRLEIYSDQNRGFVAKVNYNVPLGKNAEIEETVKQICDRFNNYQKLLDSNRELYNALNLLLINHYKLSGGIIETEEERTAQIALNNAKNINK